MHAFPRQGIEVRLADQADFDGLEKLIDANTKAVFCESIGNPAGNVVDIQRLAEIAHRHGVPVIVDNTVATPVLCKPIRLRCRHRRALADQVYRRPRQLDRRHHRRQRQVRLEGQQAKRFPILNEPDPSYHGVVYTEALGPAAYIGRCRVAPLRNTGAALSPFNAFLILMGLETLGLRMERHCENAEKLAQPGSRQHPKINWVNYAGSCPTASTTPRQRRSPRARPRASSASASRAAPLAGGQFIDALQMILRLVNIGDAKSLACHPAITTHRQLSPEELAKAGVSEDLVRISVGIEHIDDILADIDQALAKA